MGRRSSFTSQVPDKIKNHHATLLTPPVLVTPIHKPEFFEPPPFTSPPVCSKAELTQDELNVELEFLNNIAPLPLNSVFEEAVLSLDDNQVQQIISTIDHIHQAEEGHYNCVCNPHALDLIDLDNPFNNGHINDVGTTELQIAAVVSEPIIPTMSPTQNASNTVPTVDEHSKSKLITFKPRRRLIKEIPAQIIVNGIPIKTLWWAKAFLQNTMVKAASALFNRMFDDKEMPTTTKSGRGSATHKLDEPILRAIEKAVYWMMQNKNNGTNPYSFNSAKVETPPETEMSLIRSKVFVERRSLRSRKYKTATASDDSTCSDDAPSAKRIKRVNMKRVSQAK